MQTIHELKKSYEGFPSKNTVIVKGTFEQCQDELNGYKYLSHKNGADILIETDTELTCENYGNNGETVTFEIVDTMEQFFEPITTLEQFAELINSSDEWKLEFADIIKANNWEDETGTGWGICNDGTNRLEFNEVMAVISPIENKN